MMTMRSLLLLVLASSIVLVSAQDYDPREDFCHRFSHSSAVVGDRLYIDGGQINIAGEGEDGKNFTNTKLLFHDLSSTKWNGTEELSLPPLYSNLTKPSKVPSLVGGTLWPDVANAKLYQYGGETVGDAKPASDYTLWTYDIYADSWSPTAPKSSDSDIKMLAGGAGAAVEHLAMGYYLGGWMGEKTTADWQSGAPRLASNRLLEYNMGTNDYSNTTSPEDDLGRAEGVMVYIPSGDNGMLVHFGGVRTDGDESKAKAADMTEIDLYDLANQKWYVQNATGDVPEKRRRFCGAVVSAKDNSSHDIYIYGGLSFNKSDYTAFNDVHILSLPSFTWTRIFSDTNSNMHYDGTCNIIASSQLLVIGGLFPSDLNTDSPSCDVKDGAGVHNLILSNSTWMAYSPTSKGPYQVPDDLTSKIGGTAKGGATKTSPVDGWVDSDLKTLFSRTAPQPERKPTRFPPTPSSSSDSSDSNNNNNKKRTAAIVAPTVIGGLALLAGIGFLLFRRRRRHRHRHPHSQAAAAAAATAADLQSRDNKPMPPYSPTTSMVSPTYQGFPPQELHDGGHEGRFIGSLAPIELEAGRGSPVEKPAEGDENENENDNEMEGEGALRSPPEGSGNRNGNGSAAPRI